MAKQAVMGKNDSGRRRKARYGKIPKFKGNHYTRKQQNSDDPPAAPAPDPPALAPESAPAPDPSLPSSSSVADNDTMIDAPALLSATRRKLADIKHSDPLATDKDYYILINTGILEKVICDVGRCPNDGCNGTLKFENKLKEKCGLACKLVLTCCHCNWSEDYYTSKKLPTTKAGRKPFDINYMTVVAFRENGKSTIESVCDIMNLSTPMNKTAFKRIMVHLYNSYKKLHKKTCLKLQQLYVN